MAAVLVDNRPTAVAQRELADTVRTSDRSIAQSASTRAVLGSLRQTAQRRQLESFVETSGPVQRLVWPIGDDDTTESNTVALLEGSDGQHGLREPDMPDDPGLDFQPLAQLGPTETLHIVGHGDGKGRIEGMDAVAFVDYLVRKGLTKEHTGTIRLVSCLSGSPIPEARAMTEQVKLELEKRGFKNGIIGFKGLVRVTEGAHINVVMDENVPTWEALAEQLTQVTNAQVDLAFENQLPPSASKADREERRRVIQEMSERLAAYRTEMNVLWTGQQKDTNMSILLNE